MTYSDEVMADSPLVYYRLNETSGTSALDSSGNSRTAAYVNAPTLATTGALVGDSDTAVTFNGTNQRVLLSSATGLDSGDSATIEAWFNTTSTAADQFIASRWGNSNLRWFLEVAAGKVQFYVHGSAIGYPVAASTGTFNDGQWHHAVAVVSPSASVVYVDGTQVATASWGSGSLEAGDALAIGSDTADPGTSFYFNGSIDEVAIYGTALSAARVEAHYAAGSGTSIPAPVYGSDLEFANYGYGYGGQSVATWTAPAAAVPPSHPTPTPLQRVHHVLPAPTLIDGRPT